jgi:thiazole synthase
MDDLLTIAGKDFRSRLFVGTGRYASPEQTVAALDASGTELVTVAIRRLDLDNPNARTELDYIDWTRYAVLPNTAGSATVEEALFAARLGRSVTNSN